MFLFGLFFFFRKFRCRVCGQGFRLKKNGDSTLRIAERNVLNATLRFKNDDETAAHRNTEHCSLKRGESDKRSAKRAKCEKFRCRHQNCGEYFATYPELYRHKINAH